MIPVELNDETIIQRVGFWWERCLVRILHDGGPRRIALQQLVKGTPDPGLRDCGYPST